MELIELSYEMVRVTLTKASVDSLCIVNPRNVHPSQVKSIYQALCKGEHFDANFVVNKKSSRTRIIDGNHRISALRLFFKKYPDERVQAYFAVYNDLNDEKERQIFTRWNMGVNQSIDDFIHSYKDTIPMFTRLTTEFPCSVYGSQFKMKLKDMTNAYMASFEKPYCGGACRTRFKIIHELQQLKDKDIDKISTNYNIIQKIFNEKNTKDIRNLSAFKNIIYRAIYYLVANNVNTLGEDYVISRMKKILLNRTIIEQYRRFHGRNAAIDAYLAFKQVLNLDVEKKFV